MAKVPHGIETLPKISIAWVGCTNVTDDRRQTDGRTMTYSEHELEFTFAKNDKNINVGCTKIQCNKDSDNLHLHLRLPCLTSVHLHCTVHCTDLPMYATIHFSPGSSPESSGSCVPSSPQGRWEPESLTTGIANREMITDLSTDYWNVRLYVVQGVVFEPTGEVETRGETALAASRRWRRQRAGRRRVRSGISVQHHRGRCAWIQRQQL